ncbi:MAG TPA: PilZ domain-containing protein [Terriglobales bacterium]|nr:PilZ domain-containing protein [Terriglobales bacterium]
MSQQKSETTSTDWTKLLTDPDLVKNLGKLLQVYREAPAERREQALLDAMREIKSKTPQTTATASASFRDTENVPVHSMTSPPFEPDIFTPSWGQDRRRFPRIKCFVAVELKIDGAESPVWGNLSNASGGGCFVETVSPVKPGADVQIGLWVANGKLWVKGMVLTGTVTQSNPTFGVRVKFSDLPSPERENLKEFLRFVEGTTKSYRVENGYLAQLKR